MRIARFSYRGTEHYGIVEGPRVRLLAEPPFNRIRRRKVEVPLSGVHLLPPTRPVNFWGIGFNYPDHLAQAAATSGQSIPTKPRPWQKGVGSLIGPGEAIVIPSEAREVHYEGELVVVVGRRARRVTPEQAWECIFGYTIGNDVSEKGGWEREGTFWRAKGSDTFGPAGPWIETEMDPHAQDLIVRLNGVVRHKTRTSEMIHKVNEVVSYMSQFTTLFPGDLILTGAAGTTEAMKDGDVVEVEIPAIGVLRNPVRAER